MQPGASGIVLDQIGGRSSSPGPPRTKLGGGASGLPRGSQTASTTPSALPSPLSPLRLGAWRAELGLVGADLSPPASGEEIVQAVWGQ